MILSIQQLNQEISSTLTELNADRILLICSEDSANYCLPLIPKLQTLETEIVPNGESCKSLLVAQQVYSRLQLNQFSRKSAIIALGGGTVLDLAGFVASTYMRGIAVIYIPTTLLSMVDSAEGGKTGVNFNGQKNTIGTFYPAHSILTCADFLHTLPYSELLSGWAEVVKHALLNGNPALSDLSLSSQTPDSWKSLIQSNIEYKKSIVEADFTEQSVRKLLNLGHTIGHALESIHLDNPEINHGICVANGLFRETQLAEIMGLCKPNLSQQLEASLFPLFPKLEIQPNQIPALLDFISKDKKNSHNQINFSLLTDIGNAQFNIPIDLSTIESFLRSWANS